MCRERHLPVPEGQTVSRAGSRGEGQATHRRTPLSRQCFRELRRGALSPHIPPPSRGLPVNSPPSEKPTPAYMPPVMGSSLLQEAARNTRVSVLSAEPKSVLGLPRIFPCLGHGTGGPAVLCAGGKRGAGTVSSTCPGRRTCHQLPLFADELQICHPVLCRDVGGSAGSGPTDPSGPPCVPTAAPQAQEQKLKELRTLPGSGTATEMGSGPCAAGPACSRGGEPSALPASYCTAKASTRSPARVLRHDGRRGWPRGGLGRAPRLDLGDRLDLWSQAPAQRL